MSKPRALTEYSKENSNFSDEELEEILEQHAQSGQRQVQELRALIRENPLVVICLAFAFGLLIGVSLSGKRRK